MSASPRKTTRLRRCAIAALVVAGLTLMTVGAQRWLDSRAAVSVVRCFFDALRDGDSHTAMSHLHPQRLAAIEADPDGPDLSSWVPQDRLEYGIQQVTIDGSRAEVLMRIEKGGLAVKPVVHLLRSETSVWKISRIDQFSPDLRWYDQLEAEWEAERQVGEALAEELRSALSERPGVEVERVPVDNLPADTPR